MFAVDDLQDCVKLGSGVQKCYMYFNLVFKQRCESLIKLSLVLPKRLCFGCICPFVCLYS